jgi:hypothetical protein
MLPKKLNQEFYDKNKSEMQEAVDKYNNDLITKYLEDVKYNTEDQIVEKLIEYNQVIVSMTNGSTHFEVQIILHPKKINLSPTLYQRGINTQDQSVFIGIIGKSCFCFPYHDKIDYRYISDKLYITEGDDEIAIQIANILNKTFKI